MRQANQLPGSACHLLVLYYFLPLPHFVFGHAHHPAWECGVMTLPPLLRKGRQDLPIRVLRSLDAVP